MENEHVDIIAHPFGRLMNVRPPYEMDFDKILEIAKQTNTEFLCVTKGNHGALLSIKGKNYYNSGYRIDVVDTVGAGDSFLGALIYQLCTYDDPQQAIDFACAAGAMVAQQLGATPNITYQQILEFIEPC